MVDTRVPGDVEFYFNAEIRYYLRHGGQSSRRNVIVIVAVRCFWSLTFKGVLSYVYI